MRREGEFDERECQAAWLSVLDSLESRLTRREDFVTSNLRVLSHFNFSPKLTKVLTRNVILYRKENVRVLLLINSSK